MRRSVLAALRNRSKRFRRFRYLLNDGDSTRVHCVYLTRQNRSFNAVACSCEFKQRTEKHGGKNRHDTAVRARPGPCRSLSSIAKYDMALGPGGAAAAAGPTRTWMHALETFRCRGVRRKQGLRMIHSYPPERCLRIRLTRLRTL